jgi:tRNA_anti-like
MSKKYIILISILVLLGAAMYALYLYNKPHQSIANDEPAYSLSAEELYKQFDSNEEEANKTYLGKIIQVSGRVNQLARDEGKTSIYMETNGMNAVSCQMEAGSEKMAEAIKEGDNTTLKGICTGMLMDVVLVDCVIANNEK